ncbi:BolA/IbaG family iron-sulfur metabolism protein [Halioglobus sp.]|jgi:BolA protein|nr:BolA/IbaG family iron-sulfur metabolism protein [Halioglobus sp.]
MVHQDIEKQLKLVFSPDFLEIVNESSQHNVPPNSETHFRVVLVSAEFENLARVARHQSVYGALSEQMAGPVHALALHTYSPNEWRQRQKAAPESPECLGGSKTDVS